MADLVSRATGNLTSTSTWKTIETGTRAKQVTFSNSTNTTTSDVYNAGAQDFTIANLAVIEGIMLYCNRVNTTGTVRVTLSENSGTSATRTVTVNASDLPSSASWVFFKFGSTLTGDGGTDYAIAIQGSSAGNATFFRDGTTANWTHIIVNNSNPGSVAAGDVFYIVGEQTGQGTSNAFTVTMDSTATTDYGTGTDGASVNGIEIGNLGTLSYGTSAATNYYLKLSGSLNVRGGGTFNIGTTGTPIPRDSTAVLEFDPVADGGMGLIVGNGGTFNAQGLSRTSGKNIVSCKLNTDEATNSTSLGVDTDTGWLDNDEIAVGSTTRTATQAESGTLNGNAGASSLTVDGFGGAGGGLAYDHSGTSPTQAEVILLTRNINIRSATSTIMAYCNFKANSTVDIDWVDFRYLGENASSKRGLEVETTTGSFDMQYSSIRDCEDWGLYINGSSVVATISNCCFYNLNTTKALSAFALYLASNGVTFTYNYCVYLLAYTTVGSTSVQGVIRISSTTATIQNNIFSSCVTATSDYGCVVFDPSAGGTITNFSDNIIHSCNGTGMYFNDYQSGTFTNISIWRCGEYGMQYFFKSASSLPYKLYSNQVFENCKFWGNTTSNIIFRRGGSGGSQFANLTFSNCDIDSDATYSTTNAIEVSAQVYMINVIFANCRFGNTASHTNDIKFGTNCTAQIILNKCLMGGSTEIEGLSNLNFGSFIKSTNHDQTAGNHKTWLRYGIITSDSVANLYRTAAPSMRVTPNDASNKLESGSFKVNVNSGQTCTPSVYVRESVVGDGTDYNGARPRLILKRNDAIGITSDTVIDTATVSAEGAFEELTGTTAAASDDGVMEFTINCDGTTGWVNVDDFSATVS